MSDFLSHALPSLFSAAQRIYYKMATTLSMGKISLKINKNILFFNTFLSIHEKKLDSIKCFTCTTLHFSSEFYFLHFHFTLINRLNLRNVYFDVMLGKNTQCNIKK